MHLNTSNEAARGRSNSVRLAEMIWIPYRERTLPQDDLVSFHLRLSLPLCSSQEPIHQDDALSPQRCTTAVEFTGHRNCLKLKPPKHNGRGSSSSSLFGKLVEGSRFGYQCIFGSIGLHEFAGAEEGRMEICDEDGEPCVVEHGLTVLEVGIINLNIRNRSRISVINQNEVTFREPVWMEALIEPLCE